MVVNRQHFPFHRPRPSHVRCRRRMTPPVWLTRAVELLYTPHAVSSHAPVPNTALRFGWCHVLGVDVRVLFGVAALAAVAVRGDDLSGARAPQPFRSRDHTFSLTRPAPRQVALQSAADKSPLGSLLTCFKSLVFRSVGTC